MSEKVINIDIDSEALKTIKSASLNLCLTKQMQVNNDYFSTVVWQFMSVKNLVAGNNSFKWKPKYQLSLTNEFKDGEVLQTFTVAAKEVALGTELEYQDGDWVSQSDAHDPASLVIDQNDTNVAPHVVALAPDAKLGWAPFYVSEPAVLGNTSWTGFPVDRYIAFFSGDASTSQMIAKIQGIKSEVLDLTKVNHVIVKVVPDNASVKFLKPNGLVSL